MKEKIREFFQTISIWVQVILIWPFIALTEALEKLEKMPEKKRERVELIVSVVCSAVTSVIVTTLVYR